MARLIDLSQEIYTGMMVYPGHLKTVLFEHATHEETAPRFESGFSFQTKGFLLNDNGPTHVDSFSHLDPDPSAMTIDQMPLELFYGDALCVDVTGAEPRTDIPVERIERGLADAELEVRPGDIVLFLVIVWLSFLISKILRAILREEVFPRVRVAHGVPMAIDKLAHYAILLIGFFLALGAAGIDLNRFTLLAGAVGVGIGFGLQNIVSNIVSGIIILFERPVQIGDKVRIGTNDGEIRSIGLRATVVRTWEGAEVIVPNSRLVLDEVTNWTLSDQTRRVDILVGVAYGSDTDKVTELLLKASFVKVLGSYPAAHAPG